MATQEELFQDLKRFIQATITQQTSHLATKDDIARVEGRVDALDQKVDALDRKVDALDAKIDTVQASVADALDHVVEARTAANTSRTWSAG
ncbi:hypothetical protein VA596_43520 [Amycolatopsis sp., V23-08]|uniref:DUF2746 domain-containing protein n=1 Tax=Amycolatopsis heterodermiae TaxID=3110235 RepID=A0ABU5RJJ8_9PSEU|nr:hypothetical protein [Amycolatopsis sp., V23-08]MEA5366463.1 hypothetical protein [Amycolatopsis sp., V23-08]